MSDDNKASNEYDEKRDPSMRLGDLRRTIDMIDQELLDLLSRRAMCSMEVGRIKAGVRDLIFKPFREKEVIEKLLREDPGPLPEKHLRAIYREIFSSSRRLQRPQQAAYLGPEGTFSYFAGVEFLGHSVDFVPKPGFPEVFESVTQGETELGIIPLENSLNGTVGQSLDLFLRHEVFIQSEIFCKISHSLMGTADRLADVRRVYSHPQPLAQCGKWLRSNLPGAALVPMESTAAAAARASEEQDAVAVGHTGLAALYGLNVLETGIEDEPDNWTRFVVIAEMPPEEGNRDKTSLLFTLPDKAGALAMLLKVLATYDINMKKLESRPLRGEKWKYVFFVDVECDLGKDEYQNALKELAENCHTMRILGSYPEGPSVSSATMLGTIDRDA